MKVEGNPNVHTRIRFSPAQRGGGVDDFLDLATTVTALPVVMAIPVVHAAASGIRTSADLPMITEHCVSVRT